MPPATQLPFTNTHTPMEQPFYLHEGYFDMWDGEARNRTADYPISGRPALLPEP